MRLTIDREQFLKSLTIANRAVPAKNPVPILTSICLNLTNKGLEVLGSNGQIAIRSTVPYMIGQKEIIRNFVAGGTLVNAKRLVEFVRRLDGQEVSLEVIDDVTLRIDDGRSEGRLNCQSIDEYLDVDLEPSGTTFEVPCSEFTELVEQSAFAASVKEQRPILMTLHLEAENGRLMATATDSARLARKVISIDPSAQFVCNVPARIITDIVHMFDTAATVEISVSSKQIVFEFDNVVVSSRLVPGEYPLTKSIVPTAFNHTLEVNAAELLSALELVRIVSADGDLVVRLNMSETEVEVSARSENSDSANKKIETFQYVGDDLTVSFNSQFVIDAVKAVHAEDVNVCFLGQMKPFVVKNPKDDSVVELITPMRAF